MIFEIAIIVFLLILNGFFALSEMAIVSSKKSLIEEYAKNRKKSAAVVLALKENSGKFLSTVQVGITLIGILAGAYGGASIAQRLTGTLDAVFFINPYGETVAVFIVVTIITYFSVVIGEIVPKQIALNNPERFALRVARPMAILSMLCGPIVMVLECSASFILKAMSFKAKENAITETEIRAVLAEGAASGIIEEGEHDLIRRIIRLGDRDVKSIMTHRTDVKFIDINDSFSVIRQKIIDYSHSHYPVIDGDPTKVLGVIKTKEMMAIASFEEEFKIKSYIKELVLVDENFSCLDVLDKFRNQSIHIAGVIDEYGTFEGIFTSSDLLEAIVGIIPSNYEHDDAPHIVQRADGSWLLDGLTPIDEIHMTIGLDEIPTDDDYHTVAGFMLKTLQKSPKEGVSLEFSGYRFEIIDMDKLRIDKILLTRLG